MKEVPPVNPFTEEPVSSLATIAGAFTETETIASTDVRYRSTSGIHTISKRFVFTVHS